MRFMKGFSLEVNAVLLHDYRSAFFQGRTGEDVGIAVEKI